MREFLRFNLFLALILSSNLLLGQSAIFESYLVIDQNSSGSVFYDLQATTGNPDFNASNALGSFDCNSTLILNGAQHKTYKFDTDNILDGWLQYRVYEQGTGAPGFTAVQIFYTSDDLTFLHCGGTSNDQTWQTTAANID